VLGVSWLRLGIEQRTRYEHLSGDFRSTHTGDSNGLFLRTLLSVEARATPFVVGLEFQDARAWTSQGTPLNTTHVNPVDLLRGYVGLRDEHVFVRGDTLALTAGRMTLDLGSRRIVARNEFRNTINAFTGVDLQWTGPARELVRAFVVMPVLRFPSEREALEDNRIELDRENTDALLWGMFFRSRPLVARVAVEGYVVGFQEGDSALAPSANRRLVTPGFRLLRPAAPGAFDFQLEVMGQFGRSRASVRATDTADLEHLAFSLHASAGYQFALLWAPRVVVQYDHASGDRDPGDGENNRFDPLFAARRFEFGPTGVFGALARSNMLSPGLRVELQPHRSVDAFVAWRLLWLAAPRDAWTTALLHDPSGNAGDFVGQQVEARVRWQVFPLNFALDVGGAGFFRGEFATRAPRGTTAPSVYAYAQITTTL
jgi:hypothetical protein